MDSNGTSAVVVLLVLVGLGGLAFWLLTRQTEASVAGAAPTASACGQLANAAIQAGGAAKGVKTGDQSQAGEAACGVLKVAEQSAKLTTTAIGKGLGFTSTITPEDKVAICEGGWGGRAEKIGMCGAQSDKNVPPPVTPQIVAARRTFLTTALAGGGGRTL